MDYYKLLQLEREPFSNSPDPEYFFHSNQHLTCIQKLELALRLKRGLNVVVGDVGTGKTTICRELIRKFALEPSFETHLILDPAFESSQEFLNTICDMLSCQRPANNMPGSELSGTELKERIKQSLFHKGVDQNLTVVLIIDEGQKISSDTVEILRELLNYETNTHKLLQIVLFAQREFETILEKHPNFADRINLLHHLQPMNFSDTCRMIHHRLKLSSTKPKPLNLFTRPALWAIYKASNGYPRRIIHICHQSVLAMIIQNKSRAGWATIRSCKNRMAPAMYKSRRGLLVAGGLAAVIALALVLITPRYLIHENRDSNAEISIQTNARIFKIAEEEQLLKAADDPTEPASLIRQDPQPPKPEQAAMTLTKQIDAPVAQPLVPVVQMENSHDDQPSSMPPIASNLSEPPPTARPDTPPAILGGLTVKPGDTIGGLVYMVYGTYRNQYLRAVVEANPQIPKPNKIEPGDEIYFPSVEFTYKSAPHDNYWIVLDEQKTLADAERRLFWLSKKVPEKLRIIGSWSDSTGLRFQIAVKGHFSDREAAAKALSALPDTITDKADIISQWPPNTLYYSDPYTGGLR